MITFWPRMISSACLFVPFICPSTTAMVQQAGGLISPRASTIFVEPELKIEGISVKSVEAVREPSLDPRLSLSSRPTVGVFKSDNEKDNPPEYELRYVSRLTQSHSFYLHPILSTFEQIEFPQGDARNPINFPRSKKWHITYLACFSTLLAC